MGGKNNRFFYGFLEGQREHNLENTAQNFCCQKISEIIVDLFTTKMLSQKIVVILY